MLQSRECPMQALPTGTGPVAFTVSGPSTPLKALKKAATRCSIEKGEEFVNDQAKNNEVDPHTREMEYLLSLCLG